MASSRAGYSESTRDMANIMSASSHRFQGSRPRKGRRIYPIQTDDRLRSGGIHIAARGRIRDGIHKAGGWPLALFLCQLGTACPQKLDRELDTKAGISLISICHFNIHCYTLSQPRRFALVYPTPLQPAAALQVCKSASKTRRLRITILCASCSLTSGVSPMNCAGLWWIGGRVHPSCASAMVSGLAEDKRRSRHQ